MKTRFQSLRRRMTDDIISTPHVDVGPGPEAAAVYKKTHDTYADSIRRYATNPKWIEFPMLVSIETLALCNAACDFCPYPTMERKGDRMSSELFEKIVADLSSCDHPGPSVFTLCRVNEPFLDVRFFDFSRHIEATFPNVWHMHFSNASPLNRANFDELLTLKRSAALKISFNDHRKDEYERVMRLPYERTLANIQEIHNRKAAGEFSFTIRIGRVGDGSPADSEFLRWVKERFPLFEAQVSPRFDWRGKIGDVDWTVPDLGCAQWFELHILASGRDAFCCTDSDGIGGMGDARAQHVVRDLYNHPTRLALRKAFPSRLTVKGCSTCSALA